MIARRQVDALVLVHRTDLLDRMEEHLPILSRRRGEVVVGTIGGGKGRASPVRSTSP